MIGTVFDRRFRIEENLSMSANSEVYRARDLESNQNVALKLIRPRFMTGGNFGARLKQEFQVLRNLDHDNVVKVLQVGQTPENIIYFAMEYVPGTTLGQLLQKNGPIPPDTISRYLDQIADALDSAHSQKIVHRDINPNNILVWKDPAGKEVCKIFDFGLAKILDAEPEQAMVQTGAAVVHGTPAFMSPEQAMGKPVSKFSDIYSLGVLAYNLLSATVPFEGKNDLDTIIGHVKKAPPKLIDRNPNIQIAHEVEQVVFKAMAKKPNDRFESAGDFAKAFRRAVAATGGGRVSVTNVATPSSGYPSSSASTPFPQSSGPAPLEDTMVDAAPGAIPISYILAGGLAVLAAGALIVFLAGGL